MSNIFRFFFTDLEKQNFVYFIDCDLKQANLDNPEKELLFGVLLKVVNLLFPSLIHKKEAEFRNILTNKTIIGPITTFESVFSNTTKNLLNANILTKKFQINFIRFEKLRKLTESEFNQVDSYDEMLEQVYDNQLIFAPCSNDRLINNTPYNKIINFDEEGKAFLSKFGVKFDDQEFEYYKNILNNQANFTELFDLCQSNSEHSRHWFFGGKYLVNNQLQDKSLFKSVKETLNSKSNSLVAFSDNSSVISGFECETLIYDVNNSIKTTKQLLNSVLTAETHNFPTLICPFEGASTGVGGRIRDNHSTGRGAKIVASFAGYCVGDIDRIEKLYDTPYQTPLSMLVEASNGASDYGNKIGEPIIGGFTRSLGVNLGKHYEYLKPIMFSAGVGSIVKSNVKKMLPERGDLVVRLGGPAYKIGLGGGFNSSIDNTSKMTTQSKDAVQRGDPQMENKLNRVIQTLSESIPNPIKSIHDQGAGGLANVVKEIVYPNGAIIDLNKVTLGDKSLGPLEIWCSEFQESDVILIDPIFREQVKEVCDLENINMDVLGEVCDKSYGKVIVTFNSEKILDFELESILNPSIRKLYNLEINDLVIYDGITKATTTKTNDLHFEFENIKQYTENILSHMDVCSKRFLTTKVDRSVTGLISQQQCVGPFQIPVANYGEVAYSYIDNTGTSTAIGERPYLGLFSEKLQAQYSFVEMLTNISGSYIDNIENIKCSVNWMWANNSPGEAIKLYNTAINLTNVMKKAGVGIDGGKDSLSMMVKTGDKTEIVSPGNVVVTGYAPCNNINLGTTPDLKDILSLIIHVPFVNNNYSFDKDNFNFIGSIFSRANLNSEETEYTNTNLPPSLDFEYVKNTFNLVQTFLKNELLLSLHDISDGGLITTLFEMCYSGFKGIELNKKFVNEIQLANFLFSETPGVVLEVSNYNFMKIRDLFNTTNISYELIGMTKRKTMLTINACIDKQVNTVNLPIYSLAQSYESTANKLELAQCNPISVNEEFDFIKSCYKRPSNSDIFFINPPNWNIPDNLLNSEIVINNKKVLVLRDEGSNGDQEMVAYFKTLGYSVKNLNMTMLENKLNNKKYLNEFDGIAFVGGFTYSDIMGGASCWAARIKNNDTVLKALTDFFENITKFVIGVCNGFQLLIKLGIFGNSITLEENVSGRFESRFIPIEVIDYGNENKDIVNKYFDGMANTSFGIWCAHKMGRISIKDADYSGFIPILRYTDSRYPLNPNGSYDNIAGVLNKDGRILGMMPHFERSFLKYQLAYIPPEYKNILKSPWCLFGENISKIN